MPSLTLNLPTDELAALAQFVKRSTSRPSSASPPSPPTMAAGQSDTMWCAICQLQRELAAAGFAPR
jgi:hypothetical protein